MTSERTRRWGLVIVAAALIAGGLWRWKARSSREPTARATEAETERRRVAAFDPAYDPAKPLGGIMGVVKAADGHPVAGALVAVTRNRGRDELPSFGQPIPRVVSTDGSGRFTVADLIPGQYGVTANALDGTPARHDVDVLPQKTSEVTLTLGSGGAILTGEVHDVGGGSVSGAKAVIRALNRAPAPGEKWAVLEAKADDKGTFKVRLLPGDYDIAVRADGYAPARDYLTFSVAQTRQYRLNPAARLSGRVLDRQTHEPVPGASVWLRLDRLDSYVDRDATSDGEGRFSFDDLAAGGYVVVARLAPRIGLAKAVTIGIAQSIGDVEVLVERGRAIRGTVVDALGKALEGVRVGAGRSDPPYERPAFVKSDAKGSFVLEGLLPGKYRVTGWTESKGSSKPETALVTSRDVEGIRLQMTVPTVVRGQVVDGAGKPVAEANVTGVVETKSPDMRFSFDRATSGADGRFEMSRLSPGKLTVSVHHAELGNAKHDPVDLTADLNVGVLKLEAGAAVAGRVTFEDGSAAPRVLVMAGIESPGPKFGPPPQAPTDDGGHFRITGLEPGRYFILARKESNVAGGNPRARQTVTLAAGEEKDGLELVVSAAGKSIAGKVLGPDGKPVSGAIVSVGREREGFAFRMPLREGYGQTPHAVTDVDGGFTLTDLEDGKYTVWATDSSNADGEQTGVDAGTSSLVIKLPGGASVAGVVRTKDGKPVADYNIAALPGGAPGASPDDRARLMMTARMWSPSAQVHDPDGTFFIGRLSPGSYQLTVTTADGQGGLAPVEIAAGQKKEGVAILIDAGAKLIGHVVDLDSGGPLEGVSVSVTSATSRLTTTSGADGAFTLAGLPPGRSRADFELGNRQTYVSEHMDLDVKPGTPTIDAGLVRLLKGNVAERAGNFSTYGRVGFTVSLLDGKASVTGVRPGFPGEQAGLKQGDLVLMVNGRATDGLGNGALDYLASGHVDQPMTVTVQPREGGPPRSLTINRVPIDYDPSRAGANHPTTASAQPPRPTPP